MPIRQRIVEVQIGRPGTRGTVLRGLRVSGRIDHTPGSEPSRATLTLYNVTDDTVGLLTREDAVVRVLLGYETTSVGLVFEGEPVLDSIRHGRSGAGDSMLTVQCLDGGREWRTTRFDESYRTQVRASQIVNDVAAAMGLPIGRLAVAEDLIYPQGIAFHGYASEALDQLTADTKSRWLIRDRTLYVFGVEADTGERAPVFSSTQGNLIGTPAQKDGGLEVTALAEPGLRPGRKFVVDSDRAEGTYRARDVSFQFDSGWDQPFYVIAIGDLVGGQQSPSAGAEVRGGSPQPANPGMSDVVRAGAEEAVRRIPTSMPGKVIEYDHDTQRAVIQPILRVPRVVERRAGNAYTEAVKLPPVPGVPVAFPQAEGYSITFPVAVGSVGMLVFCERSMDEYLATGETDVTPQSERQHHRNDAWFVPSVRSFGDALPSSARASSAMVLRAEEIRLGSSSASKWVALADDVLTRLNAIESAFNGHIHTTTATVGTGGPVGVISPPTSSMSSTALADIKSDKVKSE